MRKLLFLILTGVLGATLFAGVASAASVDLDGDRLWAKGSGVAYLGGGGFVAGKLGSGVIIVRGDIENAHVRLAGDGQRHRIDNGFIYVGVRGHFKIVGRHLRVTIAGANAEIVAGGNWNVVLHGHGLFRSTTGEHGTWSGRPIVLGGDVEAAIDAGLAGDAEGLLNAGTDEADAA